MNQIDQFFEAMVARFQPEAARGLDAVFQYRLAEGDSYFLTIRDQQCALERGEHGAPCVTLKMKFDTLQKLGRGELDGMKAFMFGKLKVSGDMALATRLAKLFPTG
ncbi:SCP2 sterol-binding domain-containing protein [Motiliproteus sp.]|uniref:SCP2 sterol-binding domain-containing protein n=1 Tax=Motiliproteus sp. TaxID=1898955 RepID=UPI003BAA894D